MSNPPAGPSPLPPGVPGQPASAPAPPAAPPRRSWFARHKFLTAVGAIALLAVGISALSGGDDDATSAVHSARGVEAGDGTTAEAEEPAEGEGTEEEAAEEEPAAPGIGVRVADGDFEFIVTEVETGIATVGSEFLSSDAQGQFVMVHVTVTNTGNSSATFMGMNQALVDTEGREHANDDGSTIYLENSDGWLTAINPGNTLDAVVLFDIPADAVPAWIELHDSMLSRGVRVDLQ